MHQQTWESIHSLQLVLTLLPLLVLMNGNFPNKLTRTIHAKQCLALYSRWRTQQMHVHCTCFQLGLSAAQTSDAHEQDTVEAFCCYVTYCIVTTVSRYVSYRGKIYSCRPNQTFVHWLFTPREYLNISITRKRGEGFFGHLILYLRGLVCMGSFTKTYEGWRC